MYMCVFIRVCVVQTYECANVHIFARTCGDQSRTLGEGSPNFLHPIALRQGLSLNRKTIVSARLAGQEALKIYLSLSPTASAGVVGMYIHVTLILGVCNPPAGEVKTVKCLGLMDRSAHPK